MRPTLRTICALLALCAVAAMPAAADAKPTKKYYVALGDSLSVGVQPKASGANKNTTQGYANQLARGAARVKLVDFGCGGATSGSLIKGKLPCSPKRKTQYTNKSAKTSQLAAAESFLRKHRGKVKFVTVDIGANDVAKCAAGAGIDIDCVNQGIAAIKKNAPTIARRLRKAAGKGTPLAVMTLYDPFLQRWLVDASGKVIAQASVGLARDQVNKTITKAFKPYGFKVAKVAEAFNTYTPFSQTTTYNGQAGVPVAVRRICDLTWMCAATPRGPNIHARKAGYKVITDAFRKALGKAAR